MTNFPDWSALTPTFAAAELPRLLAAAERAVAEVEAANPTTYEALVWRLDDATRSLWRLWGSVCHLLSVMNSAAWRRVEADFQPQVVAFSLRVGQSRPLYEATRRALADEADPTRRRILEKMVQGAELAGVALEGAAKERFNAIQARLAQLATDFSNTVLDATKAFAYEKDGQTYTIDDAAYPQTMKHCADREVRERLCRARATRAPENTPRIAETLALRREMAALLGYADYARLSLATKCAPSVEAVFGMFGELDAATIAPAAREATELGADVRPWDVAYEAERLREAKYAYSEEELKRHFPFEATLAGLFRMAKFLFGVDVEEVAGAAKPSVWHEDVRFFAVREAGEVVAHFYLDPYVRSGLKRGGAWMNELRNRCPRLGLTPLALIVLNLPLPDAEGRCLMPFREVETLFHEFGHALQCMLTRVDEEGAAGINLVEWDAVEVASQFMENWCLDDRAGIAVPPELKAKVRAAKTFRAATACRRQLALGKTDMVLHGGEGVGRGDGPQPPAPDDVKREIFAHFGMPMVEGDIFLNSFTHIFAGGYAAGYYGYKWSEVMSADCYGAFEEAGLGDDEAVRRVGRAYRETVLALGGSASAFDVFRRFRGRAPSPAALLRQQGLARVIAVDGPSGAGKSSVSRRVGARLGFLHVDSGALYRIMTWQCLVRGVDTSDPAAVAEASGRIAIDCRPEAGRIACYVGGEEPGDRIRTPEVSAHAAKVATVRAVRDRVTAILRDLVRHGDLIIEGRDITTAVFPDTPARFYLTASAEARARRRQKEDVEKGIANQSAEAVKASLLARDRIDSSRAYAPLRKADGVVEIDSSDLTLEQVVEAVVAALPDGWRS